MGAHRNEEQYERRKRFSKILSEWMAKNELSGRGAAELLGTSPSAVQSWLRCQNDIGWDSFFAFAGVLGLTPERLLAEVRGVAYEQLPPSLIYQDVEKIGLGRSVEERVRLTHCLVDSLVLA